MSTPLVPPRPTRSNNAAPTVVQDNIPQIPPRPARKTDPSPNRDTRSPLNELPDPTRSIGKRISQNNLAPSDAPQRPPIVNLPSVGQEGLEYASYDQLPAEAHGVKSTSSDELQAPEQTRNVSATMPLHAPKASVPQSTASRRIEPVTRTDSTQAAAMGIGRAKPDDDVHSMPASSLSRVTTANEEPTRAPSTEPQLRSKTSFSRSTSSLYHTNSRPESLNESADEKGIPEIGMQIPLYKNAGDVQAPSPAPTQSQFAPGVGFFNDGSTRAHTRKRSAKHDFGPPGSYGMHGHGEQPHDQFERDWAQKHPEQAAVESYNYHVPPKPMTALSSTELNKLVNQTDDAGMGTDANMIGTPGADVAWEATQEYMTRSAMASPQPSPAPIGERGEKRRSSGTQPPVASPLRKTSFPFNERQVPDNAILADDGSVIHIDPPEFRKNKVTGGGEVDNALDLGPHAGNTSEEGGWFDERGEGTPILASDEIMKRPGSAFLQPAVSPEVHQNDDYYYESDSLNNSRRNSVRVPSRPSSRPNSMHGEYDGGNLHRFISHQDYHGSGMHTPLEEIEEVEPLIPEGEEDEKPKPKAVRKRPGLEHHHFPSQDVWEDTPSSLQYQTTVETPEPPREIAPVEEAPAAKSSAFETPEEEQQRRENNPNDMYSDSKTLWNKPHLKAAQEESRPGIQRFPSQDIWEDTPDSMRLVTTVSGPQMDEVKSPPDDGSSGGNVHSGRPSIPARPAKKSRLAEEVKPEEAAERDIPLEKQISPDKSKPPAIPDRPKPTVPMRPPRASKGEASAEGVELSKSLSSESQGASSELATSPPVPTKTKPAIPARPGGGKIAALKAGFMNDLNNRLQLGPQAAAPSKSRELEPEAAEETQKAPLVDARKSRAKGPARRKPAASPSAAVEESASQPAAFSFSSSMTLWHIDEEDALQVPSSSPPPPEPSTDDASNEAALERVLSDNTAHNTEEPTMTEPMSPQKTAVTGGEREPSLDDKLDAARDSIDREADEDAKFAQADGAKDVTPTIIADAEKVTEEPPAIDDEANEDTRVQDMPAETSDVGATKDLAAATSSEDTAVPVAKDDAVVEGEETKAMV